MAESCRHVLDFTRTFAFPREDVFAAFVDPGAIRAWWAPRGWDTLEVEMDVRVGGRYRFGMRHENLADWTFAHGEYRVIEPPERLVFTYVWEDRGASEPWRDAGLIDLETIVTLTFSDRGGATELRVIHEGFPTLGGRDLHRGGWDSNLDCLETYLGARN